MEAHRASIGHWRNGHSHNVLCLEHIKLHTFLHNSYELENDHFVQARVLGSVQKRGHGKPNVNMASRNGLLQRSTPRTRGQAHVSHVCPSGLGLGRFFTTRGYGVLVEPRPRLKICVRTEGDTTMVPSARQSSSSAMAPLPPRPAEEPSRRATPCGAARLREADETESEALKHVGGWVATKARRKEDERCPRVGFRPAPRLMYVSDPPCFRRSRAKCIGSHCPQWHDVTRTWRAAASLGHGEGNAPSALLRLNVNARGCQISNEHRRAVLD